MTALRTLYVILALVALGCGLTLAAEPNLQMPTQAGGQAFPTLRPAPAETQAFGYGSSSMSSTNAIAAEVVRIICTTDCLVEISGDPTATASSVFLQAKIAYFFRVISGTDYVAVVQDASTGIIYITPMK